MSGFTLLLMFYIIEFSNKFDTTNNLYLTYNDVDIPPWPVL